MLKKVLLIAFLYVSTSFATWSYFPVSGKGLRTKASFDVQTGDLSSKGLAAGVAYAMLGGSLELSLQNFGFITVSEFGEDEESETFMRKPVVGVRFGSNDAYDFYLETTLPMGRFVSYGIDEYEESSYVDFGYQLFLINKKRFRWALDYGVNYHFSYEPEDDERRSEYMYVYDHQTGLFTHLATEMNLALLKRLTLFVAYEYRIMLTKSKDKWFADNNRYGEVYGEYEYGAFDYSFRKLMWGFCFKILDNLFLEEEISFVNVSRPDYDAYVSYDGFEFEDEGKDDISLKKFSTFLKFVF
jgi:hypothetical protein